MTMPTQTGVLARTLPRTQTGPAPGPREQAALTPNTGAPRIQGRATTDGRRPIAHESGTEQQRLRGRSEPEHELYLHHDDVRHEGHLRARRRDAMAAGAPAHSQEPQSERGDERTLDEDRALAHRRRSPCHAAKALGARAKGLRTRMPRSHTSFGIRFGKGRGREGSSGEDARGIYMSGFFRSWRPRKPSNV